MKYVWTFLSSQSCLSRLSTLISLISPLLDELAIISGIRRVYLYLPNYGTRTIRVSVTSRPPGLSPRSPETSTLHSDCHPLPPLHPQTKSTPHRHSPFLPKHFPFQTSHHRSRTTPNPPSSLAYSKTSSTPTLLFRFCSTTSLPVQTIQHIHARPSPRPTLAVSHAIESQTKLPIPFTTSRDKALLVKSSSLPVFNPP